MARVTYGESITEYAGSIGGVTFLRNASGPIAKLRSNPPVNPSPDQSTYQVNMAKLVSFWPTLSQEDKEDWNALAAAHDHTTPWGAEKTLSGYQWFLSLNLNLLSTGQSVITTCPVWDSVSPPPIFIINTASDTFSLNFPDRWYLSTHYGIIYCSLPLRQSSIKLRRSLFITFVPHGYDYFEIGILPEYESLVNITWLTFFASADCSIIVRCKQVQALTGFASAFTSGIVKID